jgi:cytoskeletal protein CcmA (bactofilin family)
MFSENKRDKKSKKEMNHLSKEQNKIAEGTTIKGDLEGQGSFRIDGKIIGTIKTAGKIVLGKNGVIEGEITCENADLEGLVKGNLEVNNTLTLKSSAVVEGEVITGKLAIEPGADFNATCTMKGAVKSMHNDKKQTKEGKTA